MFAIVELEDLALFQAGDAQTLIDEATANVRSYCGWHIAPSISETLTLNGNGRKVLILPSLHVTAVASVTQDGILVADTEYEVDPAGLLAHVGWWWGAVPSSIVVSMTHGYESVPDVAAVIMARVSRAQSTPGNAVRVQAGPFAEQYESGGAGFTGDELATLDRYRLRPGL